MYSSIHLIGFFLVCICSFVLANNNDMKDSADRGAHSDRGGLWFGPRLGKRSLRLTPEENRRAFSKLLEAADAVNFYYDHLPSSLQADDTRVIFTPKLGRRGFDEPHDHVEFTPRLGRRLAEDMPATPPEQEIYNADPEQIGSRRFQQDIFSPRLGRTMNFSPRLGREIDYEMLPDKVRVARSTNKTEST